MVFYKQGRRSRSGWSVHGRTKFLEAGAPSPIIQAVPLWTYYPHNSFLFDLSKRGISGNIRSCVSDAVNFGDAFYVQMPSVNAPLVHSAASKRTLQLQWSKVGWIIFCSTCTRQIWMHWHSNPWRMLSSEIMNTECLCLENFCHVLNSSNPYVYPYI